MIYFLSDTHLGLCYNNGLSPAERERRVVKFLVEIEGSCSELFLVGDIFDYWFEYKRVVPKGFIRLLGQLARMADNGVKIHFFAGNHDLWIRDYFTTELGAQIYTSPTTFELQGKQVLVAHGDNLGKRNLIGRAISSTFRSRTARWMFQRLVHPDASMRFGHWWSEGNRKARGNVSHTFRGKDEPIIQWAQQQLNADCEVDYFVFGHLHTPTILDLQPSKVVILGEWIENPMYAVMNNGEITLQKF